MWRLNVVVLLVTIVGVTVAVLTYLGLRPSDAQKGGAAPGSTVSGTARTSTGPAVVPAGNAVALSDLPLQAGAANLVALPKALRDDAAFAGSLAINCPTNQSNDKSREVTYLLRRQHSEFTARIQSNFPSDPTLRATLTAIGGFKERDGTVTRRELAGALAPGGQWATFSADVERVEELTLRAQCDEPGGVVIVNGGQVSRAG